MMAHVTLSCRTVWLTPQPYRAVLKVSHQRDSFLIAGPWRYRPRCLASLKRSRVACRAASSATSSQEDQDLVEAINEACNKCLRVMLANDEAAAQQLSLELQGLQEYLLAEQEQQAGQFLGVLRSMLAHSVPKAADEAQGRYRQAINRLYNQLQGSSWKLEVEGQEGRMPEEPKFSTWDEVLGGKQKAQQHQQQGQQQSQQQVRLGRRQGPVDMSYYQALDVPASASTAEIKSAYRKLALKLHPDVSDAPDANEKFAALAQAYDTLSDETSRRLYDQYGPEGMKTHTGAGAGRGNATRAWDEFKPFKRENKRTRARDAARNSYGASFDDDFFAQATPAAAKGAGGSSSSSSNDNGNGSRGGTDAAGPSAPSGLESDEPVVGDVVEYPLGDVVRQQLDDGRSHGVGLLVGRNKDRGDAKRLPADSLELCEIEPLRQQELGSANWIPDELSPPAFCRLGKLRRVAVDSYDGRFDIWTITAPLSEGCGGPELPEEIIL